VSQLEAKHYVLSVANPREPSVAFMFPGQGLQYVNMGRELYDEDTTFRKQVDTCVDFLVPYLQCDLRDVIYPPESQKKTVCRQLDQTSLTQPALFIIEYALAQLWIKNG
jgi:phthiocerol/phenolphthiocerol synthesis type-I polyketide synthase E